MFNEWNGKIPKDILYGKLIAGKRNLSRPQLRYRDVCKRDMKELNIEQLGRTRHV